MKRLLLPGRRAALPCRSMMFMAAAVARAVALPALLALFADAAAGQAAPVAGTPVQAAAASARETPPLVPAGHRPRICLVLSGGGARGAAHIGVIKVLEEMRIPVDCIAGTSMGAIVGAAYASGMTVAEMEAAVGEITLERLFTDAPPRATETMQIKADAYLPLAAPQFGISPQGLATPKGIISGVALEAELRHLVKVRGTHRFDQLPIPFRAVATSLGDGKMYVFDRGELPTAMRASMAVPAIVAPLNLDGRLLVDGGLVRNLPVDVARGMGAEVVIAVNLGTPLLRPDQIKGVMGVSLQMLDILSEQNVRSSLEQLRPQDVLIVPKLGSFSAGDFDHLPKAVPVGEAAAREAAGRLAPYAVSEADFAALRVRRTLALALAQAPLEGKIDEIDIAGNQRVNSEVILEAMETKVGDTPDQHKIDLDMRSIYGLGDFESVRPDLQTVDGKQTLRIDVTEKAWGPDYARFGLALEGALGQQAVFDVYGNFRNTWVDRYGAEWRNEVVLGNTIKLVSSFYQPLSARQIFFIEPRVGFFNLPLDLYVGNIKFAEYRDKIIGAGADAGVNVGDYGEARAGVYFGHRDFTLASGPTLLPTHASTRLGIARASIRIDRLDSVSFTRSGYLLSLDALTSLKQLDATDVYTKFEGQARTAFSWGTHTVRLALRAGDTPNADQLPFYAQFQLGGFLNMSGYHQQQLLGPRYVYGRVLYQTKLGNIPLFDGIYGGLAYEAARMPQIIESNDKSLFQSGTAYLAADTPLGVAYLGYGYASSGNQAIYIYLGKPY